jgi:ADP-ribosyl-[dinitrogen reductase] hydrolase
MVTEEQGAGVVLGLACGDALGRPVEGYPPERLTEEFGTLHEMVGDGVHREPAGTLTDDTDMALCIARSLVEQGEFDPADVADRFLAWYESGPIGIGGMTRRVMTRLQQGEPWDEAGQDEWERSPEGQNAGNGSAMRCAPLAVAFADDHDRLQQVSRDSSRITHADPRCTHGCAVLNLTIANCVAGVEEPLVEAVDELPADAPDELIESVRSAQEMPYSQLRPTGYVIDAVEAALAVGLRAESFEGAVVEAVNLGGDTDTVGAMAGAIGGARFGAGDAPDRWLAELDRAENLRELGAQLATGEFGVAE